MKNKRIGINGEKELRKLWLILKKEKDLHLMKEVSGKKRLFLLNLNF